MKTTLIVTTAEPLVRVSCQGEKLTAEAVDLWESDPFPNLPIERGPDENGVGEWVPFEKHRYLCRYLNATREAQKRFKQRVLIDPFCGPGRIQVKGETITRDGGSVIAYRQSVLSRGPFTKVLVGDIDPDRAAAKEQRLVVRDASVQTFVGPAVNTVDLMAKAVPFGALTLAYIDPYNLEYLSFSIIERLSAKLAKPKWGGARTPKEALEVGKQEATTRNDPTA